MQLSRPARPRLLLKNGVWIDLPDGDAWILGRATSDHQRVDVDLADHDSGRGVSRWHARIRRHAAGFTLEDLESTNETTLNGRRLPPRQPFPLADGDRIGLGTLRLTFFLASERISR